MLILRRNLRSPVFGDARLSRLAIATAACSAFKIGGRILDLDRASYLK
jgi:hypothetical protein